MRFVFIFIFSITLSFSAALIHFKEITKDGKSWFGPVDVDNPDKPFDEVISEMHYPETAELKDMEDHHVNKVLGLMNEISPGYVEKHGLKFAHGKHTHLTMYKTRDIFDYVMTKGDLECAFFLEAPNPFSTD